MAFDISGNVFIADRIFCLVRVVTKSTGIIKTYAGNSLADGGTFSGDGGPATSAGLSNPFGVAVDISGNLFISDSRNNRIRLVAQSTGIVTTYAGSGTASAYESGGFTGDGGPATSAGLNYPAGAAVDISGNLFIADSGSYRIRLVTKSTGIITTYAGTGYIDFMTFSGDGGPATSAGLNYPAGVAVDISGNLFISDSGNNRIRVVTKSTGIITTYAGTGTKTFSGDGGPATSAGLSSGGVAVDISGNLFIADSDNNRIRLVAQNTGIITTYAGTGTGTFSGDDGPATSAGLNYPVTVAVDISGNVIIADYKNARIRVATKFVCSAGTYLSESTCASCAAGKYNARSVIYIAPCLSCAPGSYSSAGATECTSCAAGAYSYNEGSSSCTACPAGYSSASTPGSNAGARACTTCPAGSYSPLRGSSNCTPCPAGFYAAFEGVSACSACPANTYNAVNGSTSLNACIACSGAYISNPGSSACDVLRPTFAPTVILRPTLAPTVSIPMPLVVLRATQSISG